MDRKHNYKRNEAPGSSCSQGAGGCRLLLAKAANEEQASRIGNPDGRAHVLVYVFADLYGNLWDSIEPC